MVCKRWLLVLLCVTFGAHSGTNFGLLKSTFIQRWGAASATKFEAWQELVSAGANGTDQQRLNKVNQFFNRTIVFAEDAQVWGQADYWATPMETLGRSAGDCEDFAFAKYFTLLEVGIAPEKLRLIYVRAKVGAFDNVSIQAHMVLAYYARPDAEPWVLDNLTNDILPASKRSDLVPVFSFNRYGIFAGISGTGISPAGGTGRLSRWEDLLSRVQAEGFQ